MIKTYYKNGDSATATLRGNYALRGNYGLQNYPTTQAIGKIIKKFKETNIKRLVHHRFARSTENIAIGRENVAEDPNVSISRRFQKLRLSYGILWRVLRLDLHLHPYKVQLTQQLKPATIHNVVETWNGCLSNKTFFSDEAHFTLRKHKQN